MDRTDRDHGRLGSFHQTNRDRRGGQPDLEKFGEHAFKRPSPPRPTPSRTAGQVRLGLLNDQRDMQRVVGEEGVLDAFGLCSSLTKDPIGLLRFAGGRRTVSPVCGLLGRVDSGGRDLSGVRDRRHGDGDVQKVDVAKPDDLERERVCASLGRREHQFEHPGQITVVYDLAADVGPVARHTRRQRAELLADPLLKANQ